MNSCNKLFDRIDALQQEYITFWEEFCSIESPTDNKAGVDAAGEYIVGKAKAHGWKIEKQEQAVAGDCLCITMNPNAKGAPVCLSGHLDTVHPVGLFGTPAVKKDNQKIYGPGVADCKGGIVAAFMAMAAMETEGFTARPIKLILQSDEETSSAESEKTTVEYMCECARGAVAFLNCEPHVARTAVLQRKGIAKYTFKITGKAAHAGNCYDGISAIAEAAHKILELEKYKDKEGITFNCGIVSGGTKINTVPEQCLFQVDCRFASEVQLSEIKEIIRETADTAYIEGTTCEVVLESLRSAMELTDTNLQLLEKANAIFKENQLPTLTCRATGGGSDAAYTTRCGIPTLDSLGVEFENIHSRSECAVLASLAESAKRLAVLCCYL